MTVETVCDLCAIALLTVVLFPAVFLRATRDLPWTWDEPLSTKVEIDQ